MPAMDEAVVPWVTADPPERLLSGVRGG